MGYLMPKFNSHKWLQSLHFLIFVYHLFALSRMNDFNGISTDLGLFYAKGLEIVLFVYLYFFCVIVKRSLRVFIFGT